MRNAKVINVGVEKTADRRAALVLSDKKSSENFGVDSPGRFLRARVQVATRCSTYVICKRNALLMHAKSVSRYREETKGVQVVGRTGSYGPHEFIRAMIIYCRGGTAEGTRKHIPLISETPKLSLEKSITCRIIIH